MMDEITQDLEKADDLIGRAEIKLQKVAREVKELTEENSTVSSKADVRDGSITVTVDHRKTVEKLNHELPYPFYAKRDGSEIEIFRLEVKVDDIEADREIVTVKEIAERIEKKWDEGAPEKAVVHHAEGLGFDQDDAWDQIEELKQKGEVYEPSVGFIRTT